MNPRGEEFVLYGSLCLCGEKMRSLWLCPRMMLRVHTLKSVQRYMRINLCCRNIRVAENSLYRTQIGAVLHHVRRTAMSQHVRAGMPACAQRSCADHLPDSLAR